MEKQTQHPFSPIYNENSRILILGSFPSVKSREQGFYYGHPQNRFWKMLAAIYGCDIPQSIEEKKVLLLSHSIALYDVISSCEIVGSSDSSIKNAVPNDLSRILETADIKAVFTTGQTAGKLYKKLIYPKTGIEAIVLPSPSGANCAVKSDVLLQKYAEILKYL